METQKSKTEIGEIRTTGAEQIRGITRLAKELKESQKKIGPERRPQEEETTQGQACLELVGVDDSKTGVANGGATNGLMNAN